MTEFQLVGIDVSARHLEIRIQNKRNGYVEALTVANRCADHQRLIRRLSKLGNRSRVVMEATGVYSLDLAMALQRTARIDVMVVNPRSVNNFAKALLKRSKTDATDADMLLEFARRMDFHPWQPPDSVAFQLRAVTRRCEALTHMRTQEKNRLHAAKSSSELPDVIRNDIEVNIRHLQRRIEQLEKKAMDLVWTAPILRQGIAHLTSIKGISRTSGLKILGELAILPGDMDIRQLVAHSGLDPREHQSGSSVQWPTRISRSGNRYLRSALYMPALVAIQAEPNVKAFYEKLIARNKRPKQAIVAVMRKLLHAIFGMLKHGQDFDGEKFYRLKPENP